jgi:GDP-D-mannose 3',5'-epimerase
MQLKNRRVVVCGAGGFIGGHLVKELVAGGVDVIKAIDNKPFEEWHQASREVENIVADLSGLDACRRATRNADVVFQLAADMGGMGFIENNKALCMLSVLINTHMLLAAREAASSASSTPPRRAYTTPKSRNMPNLVALKEEDAYPALPEDGYGWEKLFSERMCRHFEEDFGLQCRGRPLPQRVWPFRHLQRRTGKGACGDLQQGDRGQGHGKQSNRDLGRRPTDPQLHVHRRLSLGNPGDRRERYPRTDQSWQQRIGDDQPTGGHRRGDRRGEAASNYNLSAPKGVNGRNSDNSLIKRYLDWEPSISLYEGMAKTYEWIECQIMSAVRQ